MVKRNPVVLLGVSLPFVIATAFSLRAAAAMTLEFFVINLFTAVVAALTVNALAIWKRAIVSVGAATLVMMFTRALIYLLLPDIYNNLGTYLYLMAINGMVLLQTGPVEGERRRLSEHLSASIRGVLRHSVVFAIFMFVVALPRELLGNGTLWGRPIPVPSKLPGMLLPFFGFISVGFLLAIVKFLSKKITFLGTLESQRRDARDRARYTEIHVDLD